MTKHLTGVLVNESLVVNIFGTILLCSASLVAIPLSGAGDGVFDYGNKDICYEVIRVSIH